MLHIIMMIISSFVVVAETMAEESSTNRPASILLPLLFAVIIGAWTEVVRPSFHAPLPTSTTIDGIDFPETLNKNLALVGGGTRSKLGLFKVS